MIMVESHFSNNSWRVCKHRPIANTQSQNNLMPLIQNTVRIVNPKILKTVIIL